VEKNNDSESEDLESRNSKVLSNIDDDEITDINEENLFEFEESEFIKPIGEYRKDFEKELSEFKKIFLYNKDDVFRNLKSEINNIFAEYDSKHFNSLVLYIGRTYEFIIYQIGWFILDDWMYRYRYKQQKDYEHMKDVPEIMKEIKGYFKTYTDSDQKNVLKSHRKYISERRNDVAHPSQLGELRMVEIEEAEKSLEVLIKAIEFFCSKFQEIMKKLKSHEKIPFFIHRNFNPFF